MYDPASPPNGFSSGSLYTSPLRIYRIAHPHLRRYWVWDEVGFLCACDTLEELDALLEAQASRPPDPQRRHYWPRARDVVHPGHALSLEATALRVDEDINRHVAKTRASRPAVTQLSLKDLGL